MYLGQGDLDHGRQSVAHVEERHTVSVGDAGASRLGMLLLGEQHSVDCRTGGCLVCLLKGNYCNKRKNNLSLIWFGFVSV